MAAQGRVQAYNRSRYGQVYGNTVRKQQTVPGRRPARITAVPAVRLSNTTRKNRDKARYMNLGYVFFLAMALMISGVILSVYLGLQADVTNSITNIARLEKELYDLQLDNDEEYSRITNSIDLEEIKRIAIQELGMGYATEGQIIDFTGSKNDYVRQVADLPERSS